MIKFVSSLQSVQSQNLLSLRAKPSWAKRSNLQIYLLGCLLLFTSCAANTGTLTIVNTTLEAVNVGLNGKNIAIAPEQHFTQKGLKSGRHEIRIGTKPAQTIDIKKQRTTLFDIGENNCFAVADYTEQYGDKGGGTVKIVEKFANRQNFTTSGKISSELGEKLPPHKSGHKTVTRLHRIDCSWIDNNQAIIDAIANLP